MFRPAIQRVEVLVVMAVLSLLVFYTASSLTVKTQEPAHAEKIAAAERMKRAMQILKDDRLEEAIFMDDVNDPNETGLIGRQFTYLTTDEGDLNAKISVLDPNLAAMMIDYLIRAGVKQGDTVAVTLTGSMPGGNLAVLSALEEMKITPIIITSVGASQWGANVEDFTWLDMETLLYEAGEISFRTRAASLGGGSDIGRRLSPRGRALIQKAIARNGVDSLESKDLEDAIQLRMDRFATILPIKAYKAFLNVGGGAAVLGDAAYARLLQPGLTTRMRFESMRNGGVMAKFGREGVPIIHVLNIKRMFAEFDYPYAATPTPEIGVGSFYASEHYNLYTTALALIILLAMLVIVGLSSKRKIKHHLEKYEPDSYV
ncbi:MAG: poly-gamma-glutamate system protein [Candidatus Marinimicrobia bacterium]|nr:poly-gamma-glutamate system protein [Candidatus Neomarinimicrobiota bacterium]